MENIHFYSIKISIQYLSFLPNLTLPYLTLPIIQVPLRELVSVTQRNTKGISYPPLCLVY